MTKKIGKSYGGIKSIVDSLNPKKDKGVITVKNGRLIIRIGRKRG